LLSHGSALIQSPLRASGYLLLALLVALDSRKTKNTITLARVSIRTPRSGSVARALAESSWTVTDMATLCATDTSMSIKCDRPTGCLPLDSPGLPSLLESRAYASPTAAGSAESTTVTHSTMPTSSSSESCHSLAPDSISDASDHDTANVMSPPRDASASDMPLMVPWSCSARSVTSLAEVKESVHEGYNIGARAGRRPLAVRRLYLQDRPPRAGSRGPRRSGPRSWRKKDQSPIATGACIFGSTLRSILLHGDARQESETLLLSRCRTDRVCAFLRPALHRALKGSSAYEVASLSGLKMLGTQRRMLPECKVVRSRRGWLDREGMQNVAFGCVAAVLASNYLSLEGSDPSPSEVLSDMQGECRCVLETTKNWRSSRSGVDEWSAMALRSEEEAAGRALAAMAGDHRPRPQTEEGALRYMCRVRDAAWPLPSGAAVDAWATRTASSPTSSTSSEGSSGWSLSSTDEDG